MFKPSIFPTALAMSLCPFFFFGCTDTKKAAEEPEEALAVAIKLLEAKDGTEFVKQCFPPAELEKLKQRIETNDIDQIAKLVLRPDKMEKMLRELNVVKDAKPVFNEARTQATFSAKSTDGKSVEIKFVLIDGKWYGGPVR